MQVKTYENFEVKIRNTKKQLMQVFLWSPYVIGQTIYIFMLFLLSSSSFFISSPNLSRRRLDVCHTSTRGVALVRI